MSNSPFPCSFCGQMVIIDASDEGTCSYRLAHKDEMQKQCDEINGHLHRIKGNLHQAINMIRTFNRPDLCVEEIENVLLELSGLPNRGL